MRAQSTMQLVRSRRKVSSRRGPAALAHCGVVVQLLTASTFAALGAGACLPTYPSTPPTGVAFADDFADADLATRYFVQGGSWRVVDGALATLGDKNLPLWLRSPLPRDVRVEFTSRSASPAVDMKVEIFGDGVRHESGYVVVLGGWNNTLSTIARLDEHERGRVTTRTRLEAGRTYRWRIERSGGNALRVFVDDELTMTYDDPSPLYGPRNDRFAFSSWESEVTFDNLRITPL